MKESKPCSTCRLSQNLPQMITRHSMTTQLMASVNSWKKQLKFTKSFFKSLKILRSLSTWSEMILMKKLQTRKCFASATSIKSISSQMTLQSVFAARITSLTLLDKRAYLTFSSSSSGISRGKDGPRTWTPTWTRSWTQRLSITLASWPAGRSSLSSLE